MNPSPTVLLKGSLSLLVCLLLCFGARAAEGTAEITGSIAEASSDPAAFANVTFVHAQSGLRRAVVADVHGNYRLARLSAGSYTVTAQSVRSGATACVSIVIHDDESAELAITLSASWSIVESKQLRDASVGAGDYLDDIRNRSEISRGQEGGNIEGYTAYAPRGNSSFNSLGQRGQDNNFLLDGMDNNESWLRGAVLMPPAEVIESASLAAVYIPAAIGHATGGSVNVRTRSGSDKFHGSAFDYLQNSALNARNFFDGTQKPGRVQNQFGASVGGPVRQNGWFYFLNGEALRSRQGLTVISTVPTAAQKEGIFGATPIYDPLSITEVVENGYGRRLFPGNQVPSTRIIQPARNLLALYPDPNLPGSADNYRFNPDRIRNSWWGNIRTDKVLSSRSTFWARLSYERSDQQSPGALPAPAGLPIPGGRFVGSDSVQQADAAHTNLTAWGIGVSHTFVVGTGVVNEIRAGASRLNLNATANDTGWNPAAALAIPGLTAAGLPVVRPEGFTPLGAAEPVPFRIRTSSYQVEDSVSWKSARHAWQFGFQGIRRQDDGNASEWSSRGDFTFTPDYTGYPGIGLTGDSIASLLTGFPSELTRDVQFAPFHLRGWEWAGFAQDEIRIWPNLSLQAGLRYSLDPPVTEASNRLVNFNYDRQNPALNQFAGQAGVNPYGGLNFNKRTLAPRIGFAWDMFGNGATVLRGGFSQNYDTGPYIVEGILAQNPPYASRLDLINGTFQVGPDLAAGLPAPGSVALVDAASLNSARGSIYAIEPRSYTAYADQWGLLLGQRLWPGLTLEIAGMGSMGIHLYETYDANQPYPAPTPYAYSRYPYAAYTSRIEYLGFAGGSTYYGGQLKLDGQPASGLRLLVTYRYAKSLDDSTAPGSGQDSRPPTPQFIYQLRANRSPSPFDITERLVFTASYDLPFQGARTGAGTGSRRLHAIIENWRASTVITAQTGYPFTPQLAVNSLNNGGYQLPDRVADGSLPAHQRSYRHWFNTSLGPLDPARAFAIPALYQYGNSGFDILRGPGLATVDASLGRRFSIGERLRLQTRLDVFNLLNQTNFALPNRILGVESAGVISHTSTAARQLEVLARVEW